MSCSLVDRAIVCVVWEVLCFAAGLLRKVCVTRHSSIFFREKGPSGSLKFSSQKGNDITVLSVWTLS